MTSRCVFFAGGGTGGHIYPGLAVAEKIAQLDPAAAIHFFCSSRSVDFDILSKTKFSFTPLPATSPSITPAKLFSFLKTFGQSAAIASERIKSAENPIVIGIGGFVSAPVCRAACKLGIPVKLINVDIVPGRANKLCTRWADEVFVQFDDTTEYFSKRKLRTTVTGCPLRKGFDNPQPDNTITELNLDKNKKVLLITGASSGAMSINNSIIALLEKLEAFTDRWQIVHLTGKAGYNQVADKYEDAKISHTIINYYDNMWDLLAAADLVIGRSGAVSIAEYTAAKAPVICIPYPHHKDRHQYLNAEKLVDIGAAIVVDDLPDTKERAGWLWEELEPLLRDENKLTQMKKACLKTPSQNSAQQIARITQHCLEKTSSFL